MQKLKAFTSYLLLTTTPSALLYSQTYFPHELPVIEPGPGWSYNPYTMTFDDVLRLFEALESGELEEKCSEEDLERITEFLIFLARQGKLPGDDEYNERLEADIERLLSEENDEAALSLWIPHEYGYTVWNDHIEVIPCGWIKKQWKHIKGFAKDNKKALLIGLAVVTAGTLTLVLLPSAAAAGAAGIAAAAGTSSDSKSDSKDHKKEISASSATDSRAEVEVPLLKSLMDEQVHTLKETIVENQFFQPAAHQQWEENARVLGSLFAHDSYYHVQNQIPVYPRLAQEIAEMRTQYILPNLANNEPLSFAHLEIDQKFHTEYGHLYPNRNQEIPFNHFSSQALGERSLELGHYDQAVIAFEKAIKTDPVNPIPYLQKGIAHFGLGEYEQSLEDYNHYTAQLQSITPLSVSEFSMGFARGLPRGIYESGEGILLFFAEFMQHPVHTCGQVVESVSMVANLVRNDEWGIIGESLSPEVHELITQWDTLPSHKRGELAGYAVGKHGADIFLPGSIAKVAAKSVKSAHEMVAICKNLQIAQETLLLETAAEIGNSAKIAEVIQQGQAAAFLGEELGFTAREMGQLKQAGQLENAISSTYEHLNLSMQESINLFGEAGKKLRPYQGMYMSESQARELIQATGIPVFPRPKGIPENYRVKLSDKPGGIKYVHPTDEGTYIRIMPGKPHSPFPNQREPYVNHRINGKSVDKQGNLVPNDRPEAHIPLDEFTYREINGKSN